MGKKMIVDKDSLTPIADKFRGILEIPSDATFPLSEFPNMIQNASDKSRWEGHQEGYSGGYSEGHQAGLGQGYGEGKLDLVQNTESLQATVSGKTLCLTDISPIEHALEVRVSNKNHFDISKVTSGDYVINNNDGSLTVNIPSNSQGYYADTPNTLIDYAPDLCVGAAYTLSFGTSGTAKHIYLSEARVRWDVGKSLTITQEMLNSRVTWYASGSGTTAIVSNIKIEYTPYVENLPVATISVSDNEEFNNSTQYTSRADGTFVAISSIYPTTFIFLDTIDNNIVAECHYIKDIDKAVETSEEQGRQQQYDEFWDSFQNNGKEYNYQFAFAGYQWNDTNFKPKYDIVLGVGYTGQSMFWSCPVTNIAETLERQGVRLDTTNCGYWTSMFQLVESIRIPELNCTHAMDYNNNGLYMTFYNAKVETFDKLVVVENVKYTSTFQGCTNLKNIVFEGVIGQPINFQWSTLLTKESMLSIMSHLSETSSGMTLTLSKVAVNKAFETSEGANDGSTSAEWVALVATKPNWTISLV